jgi:hypothetical protein
MISPFTTGWIASSGQAMRHAAHPVQDASSRCALPSMRAMASTGQTPTHAPHPVQRSVSIHGISPFVIIHAS